MILKLLPIKKIDQINSSVESVREGVATVDAEVRKRHTEIEAVSKSIGEKQSQIENLNQKLLSKF